MPVTLLHLGPAWLVFLASRRRISLVGISVGSIIPDVEIPVLFLSGIEKETGHGALHSILGGFSLALMIALLAIYLVYPTLARIWEKRFGSRWIYFAGVDAGAIDKLPRLTIGCCVGITTHLTLDYLTHAWMPYLWPSNNLVYTFSFARELWWLVIVNIALLSLLIALLRRYLGKTASVTNSPTH